MLIGNGPKLLKRKSQNVMQRIEKRKKLSGNAVSAVTHQPLASSSYMQPLDPHQSASAVADQPLPSSSSMQRLPLAPPESVSDEHLEQMDLQDEDVVFDPANPWLVRGDLTAKIIAAHNDFVKIDASKMSAKCRLCDANEPAKKFLRGNNSNLKTHLRKVS